MSVNEAVALRVSELLNKHQMTQYRLEQKCAITHGRLGCIMRNKNKTINLSTAMLLAQGFDMSLIEFLDSPYFDMSKLEID